MGNATYDETESYKPYPTTSIAHLADIALLTVTALPDNVAARLGTLSPSCSYTLVTNSRQAEL